MVCRWAANSIISMRGRWRRRSGRGDRWVDGGRSSSYLAPMALLPIIETPDPRLRVISKPVETFDAELKTLVTDMFERSEERRVGKEGVSTCRYRWSPSHKKKKKYYEDSKCNKTTYSDRLLCI